MAYSETISFLRTPLLYVYDEGIRVKGQESRDKSQQITDYNSFLVKLCSTLIVEVFTLLKMGKSKVEQIS